MQIFCKGTKLFTIYKIYHIHFDFLFVYVRKKQYFCNMKKIIPYLSVVTAMLIWAGAGIAVKEALVVFSPLTLIVLRFTLAVLLMLCIGLVFRKNEVVGLQKVDRKDLPLFMLGGLFQPFLYFICICGKKALLLQHEKDCSLFVGCGSNAHLGWCRYCRERGVGGV